MQTTFMQLFSVNSLYIGIDSEKFNELSIHLWRLSIEWNQQNRQPTSNDRLRPKQGSDRLSDGETGSSY